MLKRGMMVLACALCFGARAEVGVCGFYRDAYRTEIKAKIQAGVPFELMSVLLVEGKLIEKRAVRIAFNLWDEVVTVKSGEQTLARFPLASGESQVCRYLELSDTPEDSRRYKYRLLLNPLWSERITRLQVASAGAQESGRIVGINWQKLASEMPSDKVLLEKDIER